MRTLLLTAFVCLSALVSSRAYAAPAAAPESIEVAIRQTLTPAHVRGLIISANQLIEKDVAKYRQHPDGTLIVEVPITREEMRADTVVSAVAYTADGRAFYADVRAVGGANYKQLHLSQPPCGSRKQSIVVSAVDLEPRLGDLQSLVDIRSKQRAQARAKISQAFSGDTLSRIRDLERDLGFQYSQPLSADLEPFELLDRLDRLARALETMKSS
jgi:hypothetical protein